MKRAVLAATAAVMLLMVSACSETTIDSSTKGLHYSGTLTSGEHFKYCVAPGSKKVDTSGTNYLYPVNQRNWVNDSTGVNGADAPSVVFTSKDGVTMKATMITNFFLNTSCKPLSVGSHRYPGGVLQVFNELYGKPRQASFHKDGTYPQGWVWILGNYVGRPINQAVAEVGHNYTADQLWQDPNIRMQMAKQVAQLLPTLSNNEMQTNLQFFKDFSVSIDHIDPPDSIKQAFIQRQAAITKADTAKAQAAAQEAAANAKIKVANAQAKLLQAQIKGYGGVQYYLCAKSIDAGLPCFQPNGPLAIPTHK